MGPDVAVALGGGEGILGPALDDPGALVLVAVPHHQTAGSEAAANQLNPLVHVSAFVSDIVGGGPVITTLAPPLALNGEPLRQRVNERVDNTLREASEEVQAGMSFPGEGPSNIGETVLSESLAALAPVVLAVAVTIAITVGGDGLVVDGAADVPGESRLFSNFAPGPVGVDNGSLLVVPVVGVVFSLEVLKLPVVAVDGDAGLP